MYRFLLFFGFLWSFTTFTTLTHAYTLYYPYDGVTVKKSLFGNEWHYEYQAQFDKEIKYLFIFGDELINDQQNIQNVSMPDGWKFEPLKFSYVSWKKEQRYTLVSFKFDTYNCTATYCTTYSHGAQVDSFDGNFSEFMINLNSNYKDKTVFAFSYNGTSPPKNFSVSFNLNSDIDSLYFASGQLAGYAGPVSHHEPVPEPTTILLVTIGFIGVGILRRFKN